MAAKIAIGLIVFAIIFSVAIWRFYEYRQRKAELDTELEKEKMEQERELFE